METTLSELLCFLFQSHVLLWRTHFWNYVLIPPRFLCAIMYSVQVIGIWQFRFDGLNYVNANDLLTYFSCKEPVHRSRRLYKVQFYSGKKLWYGFSLPCVSNIAACLDQNLSGRPLCHLSLEHNDMTLHLDAFLSWGSTILYKWLFAGKCPDVTCQIGGGHFESLMSSIL